MYFRVWAQPIKNTPPPSKTHPARANLHPWVTPFFMDDKLGPFI